MRVGKIFGMVDKGRREHWRPFGGYNIKVLNEKVVHIAVNGKEKFTNKHHMMQETRNNCFEPK